MEVFLRAWWHFRDEGSAVRLGPTGLGRRYLTTITAVDARTVGAGSCVYDDAVTYLAANGTIIDDSTVVARSSVTFTNADGRWRLDRIDATTNTPVARESPNPCPGEQIP
jgi:hypothetical protein